MAVDEAKRDAMVQLLMQYGLSPEQAQQDASAIAASGQLDMRLAELSEQMGMAQSLRDTAMPEGRSVRDIYVAANPLEYVAAALRRTGGERMQREVEAGRREAREDLANAQKAYGRLRAGEELTRQSELAEATARRQAEMDALRQQGDQQHAALMRAAGYTPEGEPLPTQASAGVAPAQPAGASMGVPDMLRRPASYDEMIGRARDRMMTNAFPPSPYVGAPPPPTPYQPGAGRRGARAGGGPTMAEPVPYNMRRRPFAGAGATGAARPDPYGPFLGDRPLWVDSPYSGGR